MAFHLMVNMLTVFSKRLSVSFSNGSTVEVNASLLLGGNLSHSLRLTRYQEQRLCIRYFNTIAQVNGFIVSLVREIRTLGSNEGEDRVTGFSTLYAIATIIKHR